MMNINKLLKYVLIFSASIGVIVLFRFIPHPPNFTPVIALSFYIPFLLGVWSIPFIILSFAITDYLIGFHSLLIWTWSSLALIGVLSKFSIGSKSRLLISTFGAFLFFILTNFGVWLTSSFYEKTINGLMNCYIMAIPFFTYTFLSTIIFAIILETLMLSKYFQASLTGYKN